MVTTDSTRSRRAGPQRRRKRKAARGAVQTALDLDAILGRFCEARSFLECGVRLIEGRDPTPDYPGDEATCLRYGLNLLHVAYNDLDVALMNAQVRRTGHG